MIADPIAAAREFKETIAPVEGVEYGWVVTRAREQHAFLVGTLRRLDDKAGAVIGYLGSGSGVLALGTFAGVSADRVNPWTVVALLVPLALSVAALWFAAAARRTTEISLPPGVATAVAYAGAFGKEAETRFLGLWHLAIAEMRPAIDYKARLLDRSIWLFVAAVASLTLPLIAVAALPKPASPAAAAPAP